MEMRGAASSAAAEIALNGIEKRPSSAERVSDHSSVLSDIVVEHGPRDILGRLFLKADTGLRRRGIRAGFATFEELVALNRANSDSWRPLLPVFDPAASRITQDNGFAVIGRNGRGEAVSAHAFRLISLAGSTLKEELESLRVFYADPKRMKWPGESLTVSAPSCSRRRRCAVFSGAAWLHPAYRGQGLLTFIQPMVRAISYTRWNADFVFSFMTPEVVNGGVAASARFTSVEWDGVKMVNTPVLRGGTIRAALVSVTGADQLAHFADFVAMREDAAVGGAGARAT